MIILNIVFQLGEFILQGGKDSSDFWNSILAAIIGALSTFLVFYLTLKNQKRKEIQDKEQYRIEKVNFLKNSIAAANSEILLQIECYKEFLHESSDENYFLPKMDEPTLNEIEYLVNKINREEFFHAYLNVFVISEPNKKLLIDEFWKLFRCIYAYEENFQKINNHFKEINRITITKSQTFGELKSVIQKSITDANRINKNPPEAQQFLEVVNNGYAIVLEGSNDDVAYYNKLIDYSTKIFPYTFKLTEASSLYYIILNALLIFESKNTNIISLRKYISEFLTKSDEIYKDFEFTTKRLVNFE